MNEFLKQFVNTKNGLISANILLVFFLILLNNLGVLPVRGLGNFLFFVFLLLIFTLYRPGWSFLFFIGTIALENINVAPAEIGINVRPYQLFAALTIIAVFIRFLSKRLNFELPKWKWTDSTLMILAIAGFISVLFSVDKSLSFKQSVIAASFVAIYFLARIFIQNLEDLKKIIPFFLGSSAMVILYGIWQNWRFMHGLNSFEAMPGRPNSTFAEADWLGMFLVLLLAVLYAIIFSISNNQFPIPNKMSNVKCQMSKFLFFSCWSFVTGCFMLLILTVSRSAWLGAGVVMAIFLIAFLAKQQWKQFLRVLLFLAIALVSSTLIGYVFSLTNFQLFNRIQSTGTGLQKITISCRPNLDCAVPEVINNVSELKNCSCRHINLEEIQDEKAAGNIVSEIYRTDPNVNIRGQIYQKSWEQIKSHPIFGIGWGNISNILGKDERGTSLNSSNIFFEIWLGSGILGLLALVFVWVYILAKGIKLFLNSNPGGVSLGLFLFLGSVSLLIPNLFNAGIFMGILWLFFSTTNIIINEK
jgi:hypothetical protein